MADFLVARKDKARNAVPEGISRRDGAQADPAAYGPQRDERREP
jgi:hypothetical protein